MTQMLGLFKEEEAAATATEALQQAGHGNETFDILTGSPYPEGAFGEAEPKHRLYVFPLMGAIAGFSVGLLLMTATQAAFPLVVGGKPILSIPAMLIPMYEGTMLGRNPVHGGRHNLRVQVAQLEGRAVRPAHYGGLHRNNNARTG